MVELVQSGQFPKEDSIELTCLQRFGHEHLAVLERYKQIISMGENGH